MLTIAENVLNVYNLGAFVLNMQPCGIVGGCCPFLSNLSKKY